MQHCRECRHVMSSTHAKFSRNRFQPSLFKQFSLQHLSLFNALLTH
ncbi:hypothetical protein LHGZ1_0762 [Laribacter hongkongensis]|uniref:Uncharacterized protein n=1 Tax=Laribacter hongkongensis TaxID=168471 RepID=A0A248LHB1_9NEIS|nr:hypothetical protein LHGZ1_0762 [Laribacter hongkongensis]